MPKPMSKGGKGPVDRKSAKPAGHLNRHPKGMGKSTHPMTKGMAAAGPGASRVLKGTDKKKQPKGVTVPGRSTKSLEGKWF